jgi:hypothetical protein
VSLPVGSEINRCFPFRCKPYEPLHLIAIRDAPVVLAPRVACLLARARSVSYPLQHLLNHLIEVCEDPKRAAVIDAFMAPKK